MVATIGSPRGVLSIRILDLGTWIFEGSIDHQCPFFPHPIPDNRLVNRSVPRALSPVSAQCTSGPHPPPHFRGVWLWGFGTHSQPQGGFDLRIMLITLRVLFLNAQVLQSLWEFIHHSSTPQSDSSSIAK